MSLTDLPDEFQSLETQAKQSFKVLVTMFQRIDKTVDPMRQSRLLDDVTPKLRDCRSVIQQFERELAATDGHYPAEVTRLLHDRKKAMVKELNGFVSLRKTYVSAISQGHKVKLSSDGRSAEVMSTTRSASEMSNQELVLQANVIMVDTDKSVMRSRQVVEDTVNIGAQTATTLKGQTEQIERIADNLEALDFSIKQATKLIKNLGKQMATDKCFLILMGLLILVVIAVVIVKILNPSNSNINIPGLNAAPPPPPA